MGSQFESKVIQVLCKSIVKAHTSPYHPQCNGLVERLNRSIQAMLATCINEHMGDWEDCLPRVCFVYNTSKQTSTGFIPFYLMLGRQARIPLDIIFRKPTPQLQTISQYALNMTKSLEKAYQLTRDHLGTAAESQKGQYNHRVMANPMRWETKCGYTVQWCQEGVQRNFIVHGPVHFKSPNICLTPSIEFRIHRHDSKEWYYILIG